MSVVHQVPFNLSASLVRELKPSPTLYINERVNAMWSEGQTVYHLGFGESRFPVHPKIQAALRANVHQKSYLAGQGLPELRTAAAAFYSRHMDMDIQPRQIIAGPGSKSLIYALQMALDAELILPTPSWVSYAPQAHLLNKPVHMVDATAADNYALHIDALDAVVRQIASPNKMLLITSPNNPTGQMYRPDELQALAAYCRANDVIVISDEIYGLVPHEHTEHISISRYYPEGTVVLSGLSKHLSLGGWRLGIAILPDHDAGRRLMTAMRVVAGEIWSTPTGPVQYAGITAFGDDPELEAYIEECTRIHSIRTQYIWRHLAALGVAGAQPDGAFYMFANFDRWRDALAARGVHTSTDLAEYLLDDYQLATLPGTAFNVRPEDLSLRLASSYLDMETDEAAQAVLDAYRADPDPDQFMREHHPATNEAIARFAAFVQSLG